MLEGDDDWDQVFNDMDVLLRQLTSAPSGGGDSGTTTSTTTSTSTSTLAQGPGGSSSQPTPQSSTSGDTVGKTTATTSSTASTWSSSSKPASGWHSAKPTGAPKAVPGPGSGTSTSTSTSTSTKAPSGVGTGIKSVGLQTSSKPGDDHLRTVSNDAMSRAFQSFDELFASRAKALAAQDGYLKTRQKFMEQALASKKALTPEAAEDLVAKFWVEVLWHTSPPLFEPAPERREALRNQLALLLVRTLKAVRLAGIQVVDCAPLVAFLNWNRDCLIAQGEKDAFGAHLHSIVRSEIAAALKDYAQSGQKQQTVFREGSCVQLAFAATVAFYPFLSRLMQKFEGLKLEKDSKEHSLSPTDQDRLKGWIQLLPGYLKLVDRSWLVRLMEVLAQEVLKALPDGSADSGELAKKRRYLLLRCLQAAYIRGSVVLGLQGSPVVQIRNHELGRLFCSSVVSTIFNAAALIAAKEDPTGTLRKKFDVEPFEGAMALARAAADAMALELGLLADAALDAAKADPN